jgi:outer membrane protein assembly factor BamB
MRRLGPLLALVVCLSTAAAADWPGWLGPRRDGSSAEKVKAWKSAPKVLWRKSVGQGHSSPVVADGRVFLHVKVADKDEEELIALDAKSGEERWRKAYARGNFRSLFGNGPRATPTVLGGKVYTYGISGILTCWKATDGEQLWQVNALEKYLAKNIRFGASASPLVEGKSVLLNVGGKGASIVAFDKDSGETTWKSRDDLASYASPIAFGEGKGRQIVFLTASGVVSLNPKGGEVFWDFPLRDRLFENSTTPLVVGDTLIASSITYGAAGLRLSTKDGKPAATELWTNPTLTSYFTTPVAVGTEHLYLVTGNPFGYGGGGGVRRAPRADLNCVEAATGKILWKREKVGRYHAGLLRTGDGKILMLEDQGDLVLVDPNPKEYRELARSKVCGATWAHPALADSKLYLRDNKEILCLQMSE